MGKGFNAASFGGSVKTRKRASPAVRHKKADGMGCHQHRGTEQGDLDAFAGSGAAPGGCRNGTIAARPCIARDEINAEQRDAGKNRQNAAIAQRGHQEPGGSKDNGHVAITRLQANREH